MNNLKKDFSTLILRFYSKMLLILGRLGTFLYKNRYGLMGTLAFYMLLLIALLFLKLNTKRQFFESQIVIDLSEDAFEQLSKQNQENESGVPKPTESIEDLLKSVAVNKDIKSSQTDPVENVENMIADIKKNLITKDETYSQNKDYESFLEDSLIMVEEKQKLLDSLESVAYSGPSSVSYELAGRHKIYMPIPVYKCEGNGLVVVEIMVNKFGKVVNANVVEKESVINDDCLLKAARKAARKSRFNADLKSPVLQKGMISYNFVKQ